MWQTSMLSDVSISAGISATKTSIDLLKGVKEYLKRNDVDIHEVNSRLIELQDYIIEAKLALIEAEEENHQLRLMADNQERLNRFAAEFEESEGVYWRDNLPYCPNCWNADRKPSQLAPRPYDYKKCLCVWYCGAHVQEWRLKDRGTGMGPLSSNKTPRVLPDHPF